MHDEETVRRLAREAIAAQRIPAEQPRATWGGNGTGTLCDICGLPIAHTEVDFEVEFPQRAADPARCSHLHSQCFAAWEFERLTLAVDEPHEGELACGPGNAPPTLVRGG